MLLYTIIFMLFNAGFLYLFHFSIQHGQWIDTLFGWQGKVLNWDKKGYKFLVKAIGGHCETCYCNIYTQFLFVPYILIGIYALKINLYWWAWVLVYIAYSIISTNISIAYLKYMYR